MFICLLFDYLALSSFLGLPDFIDKAITELPSIFTLFSSSQFVLIVLFLHYQGDNIYILICFSNLHITLTLRSKPEYNQCLQSGFWLKFL